MPEPCKYCGRVVPPGTLHLDFEPPQIRAYEAIKPGWTVGIGWGRGSGKSKFLRLLWYLLISRYDRERRPNASATGVRIVLVMADLTSARRVHAQLMEAELKNEWACLGAKIDHTHWRITFPGGSWIQWVSAEQALTIKGMRCDVICVDECDQIDPGIIDTRCEPWMTEHDSLAIKVIVGTPEKGRYGLLYRTWARSNAVVLNSEGQPFENHFFSHASSYEFPRFVKREFVDKAKREMVQAFFEREYLCNWDAAEGLVYPHFNVDFHVRYPAPDEKWDEYLVGCDWGFEDPTVFAIFGVIRRGKDVHVHQLHESVLQHRTDSELVEAARLIDYSFPNARWYGDPSQPGKIEALRRAVDIGADGHNKGGAGVNIIPAKNPIEDGVAIVADALLVREREDETQWAKLLVHPDCVFTIKEYGEYRRKRDPKNRDQVLDDIVDKNNHAMDATRYALYTRFGGKDTRIITGYGIS